MTLRHVGTSRSILIAASLLLAVLGAPVHAHAALTPQFTIKGGGHGHGIGLTQYGARGYALKGWKYDAIVKHYYQGTRIATVPTQKVKVNLDRNGGARSAWLVRAGGSTPLTIMQVSNTAVKVNLDATSSYWITTSNSDTHVRKDVYDPDTKKHSAGALIKSFDGPCYAVAGGLVQLVGNSGPYSHSGVRWRGTIHFNPSTSSTSKAINYVDLEWYLYGVVPRESPSYWPAESLKAQAVVARSYAYQDAKDGRTLYCTTRSQVYNGKSRPGLNHEAASTNAAVDATKGKVVWYGTETKPVKTFFSSSSGGHTANVEHVWGSTPKPYYKGVADADQASPDYTWTVGPLSASTLASKIRDRDNGTSNTSALDYSAPSPATVTGVSTERASSGHAHHVTLTWSNGKSYRITGDLFRSILGMKSTRFSVSKSYPVQSSARYEESSSKFAYIGDWNKTTASGASGGAQRSSSTGNSEVLATFSGTGFKWIGSRGPSHGTAKVYIDGSLKKTIDLYAASSASKQTIYSRSDLNPGTHTLRIVVIKEKDPRSSGYGVGFDALDVINGTLATTTAPLKRYQETDPKTARLGTWSAITDTPYSGGSVVRSATKGARFYATFYGNEVRWLGTAASTYGTAKVSIDGGEPKTVTITSSTTSYAKTLFKATGLSQDKPHTIMIEAQGKGSGGTQGYCAVDAIEVRGGWLVSADLPTVTVQQTDSRLRWAGTWGTSSDTRFSGGSHRWTKSKDAACTLTFEGNSVAWIDKRGPAYAKMRVYLDGVDKGVVDQYASTNQLQYTLWSSGKLPVGRHTLKLVSLRSKRAAATDYTVGVDAFRVDGRVLTP